MTRIPPRPSCALWLFALGLLPLCARDADAQTAYATSGGELIRFDVNAPGTVTRIGLSGAFDGIDFRPGTMELYGIAVGETVQLYRIDPVTAAATLIGSGFARSGTFAAPGQPAVPYQILPGPVGFDIDPRSLQGDGSVRASLVPLGGSVLQIDTRTGNIAAVHSRLQFAAGDPNQLGSARVDAVAYGSSSVSTPAGTSPMYVIDRQFNVLAVQDRGAASGLRTVGPTGVGLAPYTGFDILTDPGSTDGSVAGDVGFAVMRPLDGTGYRLYRVDLATGAFGEGALVGGGIVNGDGLDGGFAVVPEPSVAALLLGSLLLATRRLR